jgi:hypothetical protein
LLAESLEIAFKRTKKKYGHCNIRIYDRDILDCSSGPMEGGKLLANGQQIARRILSQLTELCLSALFCTSVREDTA